MPTGAKFKPQREISKVKAQQRKLEREKAGTLPDLGRATYQAFIEGKLKDLTLTEICSRLKSIDEQIEEGNAAIEQFKTRARQMKVGAVQPEATCSYCKAPVLPGITFCGACGKMLSSPTAPAASPGTISCLSCSNPLAPGDRFCGNCGQSLPETAPGESKPSAGKENQAGDDQLSRCPACSATINEKDAAFCEECGKKLQR